jgi:hypothetical protein
VVTQEKTNNGLVKIIWDDSNIRSFYPDIAQVKASRDEVMLLFGDAKERNLDQNEIRAKLSERIVVNPCAAKRLSIALGDRIREYEAAYGSVSDKAYTRNGQGPAKSPLGLPSFESLKAVEQVGLLFELLKDLGAVVAVERSFKMFEKTLLDNRFLLAFKPESIRCQKPSKSIPAMALRMGMGKGFLEVFERELPEATSVGFGIEENEETCVVKAYLEFRNRYKEALRRGADVHSYVSHLGFKWDAADSRRAALARYTCFHRFTAGDILERLSKAFYEHGDQAPPFKTLKGIVDLASTKVGPDKFLYIEVSEENNPRSSFDINMYGADLRLEELFPFFMEMCRDYSIPADQFLKNYDPVRSHILGHLSGGTDRKGRYFSTIYFGEE